MNKAELAQKIADKVGITKTQAEHALEAFTEITIETIKGGNEVTLTGFGAFSARRRKGREGINPRNPSEKITVPSVVVAKFKAGKTLKDSLKGIEKKTSAKTEPIEAEETETQQ